MERAKQELGHNRVAKREMWEVFETSAQKAEMFLTMDREDIEYYTFRWTGRKVVWALKDSPIRPGNKADNEGEVNESEVVIEDEE